MDKPNPYEAPRFLTAPRAFLRPTASRRARLFGCLGAVLGSIVGCAAGALVYPAVTRGVVAGGGIWDQETEFVAVVSGAVGAMLGAIAGHFLVFALSEPPSLPDQIEAEAEARRRKVRAEIAVAEGLLAQARKDGDEEVRSKLVAYKAKLERKLGGDA